LADLEADEAATEPRGKKISCPRRRLPNGAMAKKEYMFPFATVVECPRETHRVMAGVLVAF
jgi:hypothetical protein